MISGEMRDWCYTLQVLFKRILPLGNGVPAKGRHLLLLSLILPLVAACSVEVRWGESESDSGVASDGHYENTELGFAFDYPEDWEQIKSPLDVEDEMGGSDKAGTVVFGEIDEDTGELTGIAVSVYRLRVDVTEERLDDALDEVNAVYAQLAGQAGGAIRESGETELGGRPAIRAVLDFAYQGEVPSTSEYVGTVLGDLQFELNCQAERDAFPNVRKGCREVFDSFEFTSGG